LVTRLERYVYLAVAALALCAAALAAWPAVAQAQAAPAKKDTQQVAERVVVRPGDSLWTISSERLGADATPQQIAEEAERIYALNRDRIGPDPDVLFPDQELSVPAAGKPSATAPDQEEGRAAEAPAPTAVEQPANLPKAPEAAPVPNAESPASDVRTTSSPVASFLKTVRSSVETAVAATTQTFVEVRATADGRQQLGLGIIALTFLLGGLMAWKLPMKRRVGESEAWEIYSDYAYAGGYGYYAYREKTPGLHGDTAAAAPVAPVASEPELNVNGSEGEDPATEDGEEGVSRVGLEAIARARRERIRRSRRSRARRFKRLPRRGLAASVYSPEVRSSLRGSVPRTQPRTPRNGRVKIAARQINGGR
jgi:hypothetical protein